MTALDVSVVICAYTEERWPSLREAVESVARQSLAARETIVVIDHNPGLLARARVELPAIVVENTGQRGLSDGRNAGVRAASGSVIAFLDDDAVAEPDWLARLADAYQHEDVIGVGGSAEPVWLAGARPGWWPPEFDWVVGCSYRGMPSQTTAVRNFLGCNMSFRRLAFELAGAFDPAIGRVGTLPTGCEETEFCIRLAGVAPGRRLIYEPAARVRHSVPASRATWRYYRSRCYSEGISKAIVSRLAGSRSALSVELRYTLTTLLGGVARNLAISLPRLDPNGIGRAGAIAGGLACTAGGYLAGRMRLRLARARHLSEPTAP